MRPSLVIKLTGTLFIDQESKKLSRDLADTLAKQLAILKEQYCIGLVIGGGAFFRGAENNDALRLRSSVAHTIGMLATTVNGLMFYEILYQHNLQSTILCALNCPSIGNQASQQEIDHAMQAGHIIIFTGGAGNPYVSSDTGAVIRTKQMKASQLWKATRVDGVYTDDPYRNSTATLLPHITHQEALDKKLGFMDSTAITLAQQEHVAMRIFNIALPDVLLKVARQESIGTIILT